MMECMAVSLPSHTRLSRTLELPKARAARFNKIYRDHVLGSHGKSKVTVAKPHDASCSQTY